jgi:hypothetical protein
VCDSECAILVVRSWVCGPGCAVLGVRSWVCGPGCAVLGVRSWVCGPGCAVLGRRSWVCGPGYAMHKIHAIALSVRSEHAIRVCDAQNRCGRSFLLFLYDRYSFFAIVMTTKILCDRACSPRFCRFFTSLRSHTNLSQVRSRTILR